MGYVIYCQNDRNKKCNQVSINLCGLLFLVIFSLGLVFCFLPATKHEHEEMTIADFLVGLVSAIKKGSEFFGQVCVQSAKAFFCPSGQSQSLLNSSKSCTGRIMLDSTGGLQAGTTTMYRNSLPMRSENNPQQDRRYSDPKARNG